MCHTKEDEQYIDLDLGVILALNDNLRVLHSKRLLSPMLCAQLCTTLSFTHYTNRVHFSLTNSKFWHCINIHNNSNSKCNNIPTLLLEINYFGEQVRRHTHTTPNVSEINLILVTWNHWTTHCLQYLEGHIVNLFSACNLPNYTT